MRRGTHPGRLITGAAALTTIVVLGAGTTPALAATKKPAKDPLASVRTKALSDITVYGKRLTVVRHTGAASTVLTADDKLSLSDLGVLQGVSQRDDRIAVARARSRKAIAAAVSAAQRTVAVGSLELTVTTSAETRLAVGNPLTDDAATLTDEATDAAANGDDTTDLTEDLDNVTIDLESAQGDEATAVSDILTLGSAATAARLKAAASTASEDLDLIDQDISDATDDLAAAESAYDDLTSGTDPGTGDGS